MRWEERVAWFIGETARPLSQLLASMGATYASCIVAHKVTDGNDGAIFLAAVFAGVGTFYGFKAVENWKRRAADAQVEIARATNDQSSGQ